VASAPPACPPCARHVPICAPPMCPQSTTLANVLCHLRSRLSHEQRRGSHNIGQTTPLPCEEARHAIAKNIWLNMHIHVNKCCAHVSACQRMGVARVSSATMNQRHEPRERHEHRHAAVPPGHAQRSRAAGVAHTVSSQPHGVFHSLQASSLRLTDTRLLWDLETIEEVHRARLTVLATIARARLGELR